MSDHTTRDQSPKLCECGCGQPAAIAKQTRKSHGAIKGQPLRFARRHRLYITRAPEERFWEKVDKRGPDECWEWQAGKYKDGYGKFSVNSKHCRAHRFSYKLHNGPIPDGLFVCHNCPDGDNPLCVNPAHLWLGTQADNMHDMDAKGRRARVGLPGESSPNHRFTDEIIRTMRRRWAEGERQKDLAIEYGLTPSGIHNILRRKCWKHI